MLVDSISIKKDEHEILPPHFVKKHEITAHHEWAVPPLAVSRNLTGSGGGRAGGEEGKVLQIKKGKLGV